MFAVNAATIEDEGDMNVNVKNRKKIPRELYEKRAVTSNEVNVPKNETSFGDVESFQNQKQGGSGYAALGDFPSMINFPPVSVSAGGERMATRHKQQTHHQPHQRQQQQQQQPPGLTLNEGFSSYTNQAKMMNNWNTNNMQPQQQYADNKPKDQMDLLVMKLNYVISLLEDQQDEKTNNVPEEVILYCFLGIFVIFIVDSFVRVGKYVR